MNVVAGEALVDGVMILSSGALVFSSDCPLRESSKSLQLGGQQSLIGTGQDQALLLRAATQRRHSSKYCELSDASSKAWGWSCQHLQRQHLEKLPRCRRSQTSKNTSETAAGNKRQWGVLYRLL